MADIELIIKMPEKTVNAIKDNAMFAGTIPRDILWDITSAIVNGTPLPKGHGRLGDLDALKKRFLEMAEDPWNIGVGISSDIEDMADVISNAPTIIEADKGEEE